MSEFVNTIDILGDDAVIDGVINRTIIEFKDDVITKIGDYAFAQCKALTEVDVPNVTSLGNTAFSECDALRNVKLPSLTTIDTRSATSQFKLCPSLESIDMPKLTTVSYGMLNGSSGVLPAYDRPNKLKVLDLRSCTYIDQFAFQLSCRLTAVILRANQVVTLVNTNALKDTPITNSNGYIYVPSALVDSYKAATNWSTYADKIRAIEDYTVDGSLNGEFVNPVSYIDVNTTISSLGAGTGVTDYIEVAPGSEIEIVSTLKYNLKAEMFDSQYTSLGTIGALNSSTISGALSSNAKYIKVQFKIPSIICSYVAEACTISIGDTMYIPIIE